MSPEQRAYQDGSSTKSSENVVELHEFREFLTPAAERNFSTGMQLINTRLWVNDLRQKYGDESLTLDTIPSREWKKLFAGFDSFWFMGVYAPSEASREHAAHYSHEYKPALPDLDEAKDIVASPFAIVDYSPNPALVANWEQWDSMKSFLNEKGKKAILDFVPNHMAIDHPWAKSHPEYFIQGTFEQFQENPNLYQKVETDEGITYYLAHGKDPNFPEWADTLQLNYANPVVQDEMEKIVVELASHSDGVRCDMAMLLNPTTFLRTWGSHLSDEEKEYIKDNNFWERVIPLVKEKAKGDGREFMFIAEAYWEKDILGKYFDRIYAKDFYDHMKRVVEGTDTVDNFRAHIQYLMDNDKPYNEVFFTENHDEERAVTKFGDHQSRAVACITAFLPQQGSVFLLNQGQEEGRRIRPPMQIGRFPPENKDTDMENFYKRLLALRHSRLFENGTWKIADCDQSSQIVALQVEMEDPISHKTVGAVVTVNLSNTTASGRLTEITKEKKTCVYRLNKGDEVVNPDRERDGGMYIELIPWETQIVFYQ